MLIRQPAVSRDHLAFVYAGDIWLADRSGNNTTRLTTHPADELAPAFSPDGKMIAFSARYDGNTDVYVMPISGGQPKRLTWHPGIDTVNGWSNDGKRVLFASSREVANGRSNQLYEVAVDGGFEKKIMEAQAFEGRWSADGKRIAYRPYRTGHNANAGWRLHRGGSTPPIWIIDPATNAWERVPATNANDTNPLWVGGEVVFISDRDNVAANLFAYSTQTKAVRQLTKEGIWDVRNAAAYGDTIVYEVGGRLKELNVKTNAVSELAINIATQAPQARPQYKDAAASMTSAFLSSTGKRVVVTARGDVFTVPVKDGSVRNITQTSGVREKDGIWSPDGKQVAYISDAGRKHALMLRDQTGVEPAKSMSLGTSGGYFNLLAWSPDGKTIIYADNMLNLYAIALDTGASRVIDNRGRRGAFIVSFSPDSRWLAYITVGNNYLGRVRIHDFTTSKSVTVTDGMSQVDSPVFGGSDYLYFTASINAGPSLVGLDMSSQERPVRNGIYAIVLAADGKSPIAPRTADEDDKPASKADAPTKAAPAPSAAAPASTAPAASPTSAAPLVSAKDDTKADTKSDTKDSTASTPAKPPKPVRIDFDGIQNRIVALPVAERNYSNLQVAADGSLFYLDNRQPGTSAEPPDAESGGDGELIRFSFEERKPKAIKQGLQSFSISADGKKMLLRYLRGKLEIADANEKLDAKPIDMSQVGMLVNPREEWQQIFDEAWWMQKEFFYDAKLHGIDWDAVYKRYQPMVAHVQRREDLNDVLREMIAELQVGHNNVGGGDVHRERPAAVGMLGADFAVEGNRYRIQKIYAGDRWNPFLRAPLAAPGLGVREGDYLFAVNGRELTTDTNLFAMFDNTVNKQVTLTVGGDVTRKGARNIVVQPIAAEGPLRQWHWIESNRAYVDKATNGRVAYVYLPDTGGEGYKYFNRMFFAQVDRDGIIVDDRRNSGGQAANYVTELLGRPYLAGWKDRAGMVFETPGGGIYGPKAMLIDQDAGSGGDFLPYAFKRMGLGPLIGKRTWGGLIGISTNPPLIDGGTMSVPFFRFFTPEKEWRIENEGVAPDMDVELDPTAVNRGRDTQLDAAIQSVMQRMSTDKTRAQRLAPPKPAALGK
ncbi:MAG: PD40 domain-containing protein [Aeromicrobium sp.]|nr:PD40 domain-containing protein [Burkholderiales bacterium]